MIKLKFKAKISKINPTKIIAIIITTIFISTSFFFQISCINSKTAENLKQNKTTSKNNNYISSIQNKSLLNPFVSNPVKDTYNYPNIPSDFLTYEINEELFKNNYNQLIKDYKNNIEIYNYIKFYEILKNFYNFPESILKSNITQLNEYIKLSQFLESAFKNKNQYFKAKYFAQFYKTFTTLKSYILQKQNMDSLMKSRNLTAIANMIYISGEKLLIPASNFLINKALTFKKYDIPYFLGGKFYLLQNNMKMARLYFGLGLKYLTKKNNENILATYYYQTRETFFNYKFIINFTNRKKIENISFKLFIPNNTEYQNLSKFQITIDNKITNNYTIFCNSVKQNILNINFNYLKSGNHQIVISMNIHTIPFKSPLSQISKYNLNDYDYSNPLIKATLKPSNYFDYDNQKVKNYIENIKKSLPPYLQNNILALTKQAYIFVINKLKYDVNIMNNPEYRISLDQKYGKDALRCLLRPENSVCENYATLLTTILKGLNIPAFYVYGPVYRLPYHAWVKVLLPDNRFYILDPTFADPIGQNGDDASIYFFYNPANRIEETILDPNYPIIRGNPESNIAVTYTGGPIYNLSYRTILEISK